MISTIIGQSACLGTLTDAGIFVGNYGTYLMRLFLHGVIRSAAAAFAFTGILLSDSNSMLNFSSQSSKHFIVVDVSFEKDEEFGMKICLSKRNNVDYLYFSKPCSSLHSLASYAQ
jgi:hypothetical protein